MTEEEMEKEVNEILWEQRRMELAAPEMYEALNKWRAYAIAQINAGRDRGGECKAIVDALRKADGLSD